MSGSTVHVTYAISFAVQLGFLIVATFVGFLLLGLWVDRRLHSGPLFLLVGIVLAFAVTIYEVFHALKPIMGMPKGKKHA